jgi:hypothetical protein
MPAKGRDVASFSFTVTTGDMAARCARDHQGANDMETSIFLARLLGPSMLVIGLGLLLNRATYRDLSLEVLDSPALIYLAGLIAFAAGLAIVLTHNVWVAGWPVIITIFGWASLAAGIFRIVFPTSVMQLGRRLIDSQGFLIGGIAIYLLLGAWLSYAGYAGAST